MEVPGDIQVENWWTAVIINGWVMQSPQDFLNNIKG